MVVVTHEMGFAREVGHRVLFLDQGRFWKRLNRRNSLPIRKTNGRPASCPRFCKGFGGNFRAIV